MTSPPNTQTGMNVPRASLPENRLLELIRWATASPLELIATSFVFVRHGETDGNKNRIFQTAEQPLNARGLAQAAEASNLLSRIQVKRIYASTMPRAWRTAEIIAHPHSLTPIARDTLRERWFGSLVGTPATEIDWAYDPPGGERLVDFVARTREGLLEALSLDQTSQDGGTAIVAHGGNLRVLAFALRLDLPHDLFANATPLRFTRRAGDWIATPVGRVDADVGAMT